MSNGGGWTVFQRRMDGTVDFFRTWADYLKGFGDLKGEFWLGLNKIHRLTQASSRLRVDLEDFEGMKKFALYSSFMVKDADTKYTLAVSGYSGNVENSLSFHNGNKFSTRDKDNDEWVGHSCARRYKGAWWYRYCHHTNLNGLYLAGHSAHGEGINWTKFSVYRESIHLWKWRGYNYSLKTTEMKTKRN